MQRTTDQDKNLLNEMIPHISAGDVGKARSLLDSLTTEGQKSLLNTKLMLGNTLLHLAVESRHCPITELLLSYGADINTPGDLGRSPLHMAAYNNDLAMLRLLLNAHADMTIKGDNGEMPIHLAAMMGADSCVNELLSRDAALLNAKGCEERTPFYYAACANQQGVLKILLSQGADINQLDRISGLGAVHLAVKYNIPGLLTFLKGNNADMNLVSNLNCTALQMCFMRPNPSLKMVQILLIDCGADATLGRPSPLQLLDNYASRSLASLEEIRKLLIKHGAKEEVVSQLSNNPRGQ